MTMFQKGEWAVLRHDAGGRLFQVEEAHSHGEREVVTEVNTLPNQPAFRVLSEQLVKVENREEAVALVAVLDFIHHMFDIRRDDLRKEEQRALDIACGRYEVFDEGGLE